MFLLADLDIDVKVLLFGLARCVDDRLTGVEHAVVVHVIEVVITRVIAGVQLGRISSALRRLWPNRLTRSLARTFFDALRLFGLESRADVLRVFLIVLLWLKMLTERAR